MSAYRYYSILEIQEGKDFQQLRDFMFQEGCLGLEPKKDGSLKIFFEESVALEKLKEKIRQKFPDAQWIDTLKIGIPLPLEEPPSFSPFPLEGKFWIFPKNRKTDEDCVERIVLDPGMAFGTGRHESTQLLARLLLNIRPKPRSMLDVGTGSGILAILARRWGIYQVAGVEIAEEALAQARENFADNGVEEIQLFNRLSWVKKTYSLVVANMTAPTLIHLAPSLASRLERGGKLLLSGFLHKERVEIEKAFSPFQIIDSLSGGEFEALCFILDL